MKLLEGQSLTVPVGSALLLLWLLYRKGLFFRFHHKYNFPNLVPGVPLFGNMLQIPTDTAERRLYLHKLAAKYGSHYWLFMNSQRVANEILDKRGARYISHQNLPMPGDVASGGKRIIFMPNRNVFAPLQDVESRALLYQYLAQPDLWHLAHARTKRGDPNVDRIIETNNEIMKMFEPGSSLIDSFPWLASIPLPRSIQPWRWWGNSVFEQYKRNFIEEFQGLTERQRQGKATTCFISEFQRLGRDKTLDYVSTVFLAGSLIEAGSDTTRVALNQLLAGAALFPDSVRRARKELDEICGANAERLPVASDVDSLSCLTSKPSAKKFFDGSEKPTYLAATSLPEISHSLIEDDSFEGYNLPAGTNAIWNTWGVHMGASEYEQPGRFWPERFLNEDLDKPIKGHLAFGAGRRVCPGWLIASNSLQLLIARVLYCFDFHTVPGHPIPVGKPLDIGTEKPYEVKVMVRSPAHAAVIQRECAEAANIE
ncbi:Hypothetical protein NCS54_00886500 [Fusarium falciforme]|uniref:Hypothetical protein n=1 Tax=Fusarium falciforme TaxID=195108 RepID=UPI0023006F21|nr:Hypothetical protein NCS54_00886500 [Fusarium falciforme]WAO91398.1 Hypothetical protein NCS54_00886500 [Fusarium falciforme]